MIARPVCIKAHGCFGRIGAITDDPEPATDPAGPLRGAQRESGCRAPQPESARSQRSTGQRGKRWTTSQANGASGSVGPRAVDWKPLRFSNSGEALRTGTRRQDLGDLNGFSTRTLNCAKSATLRVTTVRLWTAAVAAIIASSYKVSDRRCISRAHVRNVAPSMGSTL